MTDQTASAGRGGFSMHRVIERIGIHNISLLVALVGLLVIFGVLRGDVFFSVSGGRIRPETIHGAF